MGNSLTCGGGGNLMANFPGKYDQNLRAAVQRAATEADIDWAMTYLDFNYCNVCLLKKKYKDDPTQADFRKKAREECERILRMFITTGKRPIDHKKTGKEKR